MKKVLIVATVSGFLPQFEMNNVKILQSMNYEVHYASNFMMPVYLNNDSKLEYSGVINHHIDFVRSPFRLIKNYKAYKQLANLMKREKYDLVHCHTPMGGVLGRIAALVSSTYPVIYTAHGFHFYKKSHILNWLFFYPVERILARYTDILITINNEDYHRAMKFKLRKNGILKKVNGVGIKSNENEPIISKKDFKINNGIPEESYIIVSVGELTKRKNHKTVIKSLVKRKMSKYVIYLICGTGKCEKSLKRLVDRLDLSKRVIFLGYQQDINSILGIADCFIFPSLQEGLPVALMEAMAAGLPIICSDIRGNIDLIVNSKGGILVDSKNPYEFADAIEKLAVDELLRIKMGEYNKDIIKNFSIEYVDKEMKYIYEKYIDMDRVSMNRNEL
jgi:glycosyltransferase involved in cell wall biosynthesis